ncbi:MAG: Quinonprotein alcohol dehydrogenase, partial [Phycisphaerales bacterium]|nr:Quinonprotein alcohol dehydrogenase [Phycisphaerales bacterium]
VTFGSPGTACLDAATGDTVWERTDFVCNHFRGAGSSPCVAGGRVYLNFDGSDFQYVAAMDAATGKTIWKTDRSVDYKDTDPKTNAPKADGDFRKGFSTARVVKINGADQLLSVGGKAAYGYDPATGKEIWRLDFAAVGVDSHSPGTTPVVGPDLIYIPTGSGKSELLAVRPGGTGAVGADRVVWRVKKNVPKRPSPLLHDGLLYTVDDDAIAVCLDAATGAEVWKQRVNGKNFSASPVLADGRVYLFGENGVTTTLAAGREFKKLGEGEFPDGFMNGPAVADGAFFLRTKTTVYRVQK